MSDDNTTPRPWVVETSTWEAKTGYRWSGCGIEQDPAVFGDDALAISYATREGQINTADAALIVRAVNSFDALMEACEAAETWFSGSVLSAQEQHIAGLLRAALAKAGK